MVYLVGAGPGDPGLMTVKGLECLAKAEVVIYDYLAALASVTTYPLVCDLLVLLDSGTVGTSLPLNFMEPLFNWA